MFKRLYDYWRRQRETHHPPKNSFLVVYYLIDSFDRQTLKGLRFTESMWEKHLDYISSFPFSFVLLLLLFLYCRFHHLLPLILPFDMLVKFFLLRIHRQCRREKCAICGSMVHMTRVKSPFINHGANDLTLFLSPFFFYLTVELSSLSSSLTNLSQVLIKVKYTAHHTKLFFHYREDTTKQPQKKKQCTRLWLVLKAMNRFACDNPLYIYTYLLLMRILFRSFPQLSFPKRQFHWLALIIPIIHFFTLLFHLFISFHIIIFHSKLKKNDYRSSGQQKSSLSCGWETRW